MAKFNIKYELCANFQKVIIGAEEVEATEFKELREKLLTTAENEFKKLLDLSNKNNIKSTTNNTKTTTASTNKPASEKQKNLMKKLNIDFSENISSYDASKKIEFYNNNKKSTTTNIDNNDINNSAIEF